MLVDARQLPNGSQLRADLCIVGGGMAGIAIARELLDSGISVLVLESGGEARDATIQSLTQGTGSIRDADGHTRDMTAYLPTSRVRAFGGSGHVWGGKCGPLDEADFLERPWIANSGWPFTRSALNPYYERACAVLKLPSFNRDLIGAETSRPHAPIADGADFTTIPRFHSRVSGVHSAPEFDAFRYGITTSPRVQVCLHANVTQVRVSADGRAVTGLDVRTLDGKLHHAVADHYVLATGGMENARLMLLSTATMPSGVGNERGLVGRFFAGHLNASANGAASAPTSGLALSKPVPFDLYTTNDISKVWGIYSVTLAAQRRFRLPNTWFAFVPQWYQTTPDERNVLALANTTMRPRGTHESTAVSPRDTGAMTLTRGTFVPFRVMSEESPNPDSRLTLSPTETDALHQPRLQLDWRLSASHHTGLERSVELFAQRVGGAGFGRVRWPLTRETLLSSLNPARHHIGATRMHTDPHKGVVNENCRVHGLQNLHVAGSSVFPTAGNVNPTLTIVALSLRLADHLRTQLRRAG